jgi:hypothetical protein
MRYQTSPTGVALSKLAPKGLVFARGYHTKQQWDTGAPRKDDVEMKRDIGLGT